MEFEIYQIGKVPPLTVVEADKWVLDDDGIPRIKFYKKGRVIAMFYTNNIAGFKELEAIE